MRISDWSSDVCSSDLEHLGADVGAHRDVHAYKARNVRKHRADHEADRRGEPERHREDDRDDHADDGDGGVLAAEIGLLAFLDGGGDVLHLLVARGRAQKRSEEHTSELPSLIRHEYSVCGLTKTDL